MRRSKEGTGNIRVGMVNMRTELNGADAIVSGTWVPLKDGRALAEANRVLDALRPLFDYVPGDISPPPAPKHTTNSNKPRVPKPPAKKVASMCLLS